MIKRFYYGLISLYYSFFLTGLPLVIFVLAFARQKNPKPALQYGMIAATVLLAVIMAFYYAKKINVSRSLKNVENIEEYEKGGMLDRSYLLEDRMLAGFGLSVHEYKTTGITKLSAEEKGRKVILTLTGTEGEFKATALDRSEAERFAAFIQRKNPDVILENITPKGSGTLKELGAVI